ncbi:MAG: type II CRISPR-associated endonuclease Cas1 [Phycisphaerae bacterium]|nr:type II CRISPR-associated endonuclease Cas1 [Phycisphaerae bacterium]
MIKRTIEISQEPAHLTVKNEQLLLLSQDSARDPLASVPCEDIGLVLVEHAGTTYSHAALATLMQHGASLVICGRDHLPSGVLLPLAEHSQVVWRVNDQINLRKPLRKQLWQQLVRAKVRAQAANLPADSPARSKLLALARQVRSGDPNNIEAQAARVYWAQWLSPLTFRRDRDGKPPNNLLNYGYAVVRAAVARALVAAGLLPVLGIHHSNRANSFCLADDLVEPLRPIVDARVRKLFREGRINLVPKTKAGLLELLTTRVTLGDQSGPLMVMLHRMVASLVRCYEGTERRLSIPVAEDPCG